MIDPACNSASIGDAPRAPGSEPSVEIDIQRIMQMIPHRHPFLMIDKVIDVVANERATGIKNIIDQRAIIFRGTFRRARSCQAC